MKIKFISIDWFNLFFIKRSKLFASTNHFVKLIIYFKIFEFEFHKIWYTKIRKVSCFGDWMVIWNYFKKIMCYINQSIKKCNFIKKKNNSFIYCHSVIKKIILIIFFLNILIEFLLDISVYTYIVANSYNNWKKFFFSLLYFGSSFHYLIIGN